MNESIRSPKEVQQAETKIRQILDSLAVELSNRRELDQQRHEAATTDLKFWVNAYAPYSLVRSVERQEVLMKKMEKDSKRMTWLTIAIAAMTLTVVVLSIVQICKN